MTARHNMTPAEFREALDALGLTPTAFAKLIGSNDKNMRRAAEDGSDGPGPAASFALRCLLALDEIAGISEGRVEQIAANAVRGEFQS